MKSLLKLISSDNFICVNKTLIKKLGLQAAVLIGELSSQYNYYSTHNQTINDYFYLTASMCTEHTGLSYYEQQKAIEKLESLNIISTKVMGLPAKKYYLINEEALLTLLNDDNDNISTENSTKSIANVGAKPTINTKNSETIIEDFKTNIEDSSKQVFKNFNTSLEKSQTNNNIINNNINNNTLDNKLSKEEVSNFLLNSEKNTKHNTIHKSLGNNNTNNSNISNVNNSSNIRNNDNTRSYKNLVEFIKNLNYNESTISNLLLWYNNVGKGRTSIKQLKDKITKLHLAKYSEEQISEAFYNSYMNGWFAFYVVQSHKSKTNSVNLVNDHIESVKDPNEELARNPDGSLMEF